MTDKLTQSPSGNPSESTGSPVYFQKTLRRECYRQDSSSDYAYVLPAGDLIEPGFGMLDDSREQLQDGWLCTHKTTAYSRSKRHHAILYEAVVDLSNRYML